MNSFNRVILRKSQMYSHAKRAFSQNTTLASMNPDRNRKLRVMSTPEWPVPYWQRSFRHDPVPMENTGFDITAHAMNITDVHVIFAKEYLKSAGKGYVVEAVENHFDIKKYTTSFEDSVVFTDAYIDDLLDSINIANKQNVELLNKYDLSDCLK